MTKVVTPFVNNAITGSKTWVYHYEYDDILVKKWKYRIPGKDLVYTLHFGDIPTVPMK